MFACLWVLVVSSRIMLICTFRLVVTQRRCFILIECCQNVHNVYTICMRRRCDDDDGKRQHISHQLREQQTKRVMPIQKYI